ncbi:ATP-binding cassette domain-containing protein [Paenibacillus marinisediminis]
MAIVHGQNISYQYPQQGIGQQYALNHVNLQIEEGLFTAVLGATGSGKSTLMQHFNGIYQPTDGRLQVFDVVFNGGQRVKGLKPLRSRVGLVFQFPEQQLFEETLEKDLMFGPLQFGMSKEAAREAALEALREVGLSEELLSRSPFELSGGQMRKAAIATVLASNPEMLVLDEPTATLDPVSRNELIELLKRLCVDHGKTIVMVTHRLDEVLEHADRFILMKQGTVSFEGTRQELLDKAEVLSGADIELPSAIKLAQQIQELSGISITDLPCSVDQWVDWFMQRMNSSNSENGNRKEGS